MSRWPEMRRRGIVSGGLGIVVLGFFGAAASGAPTPAEAARIERLIRYVEAKPELRFVRNGTDYSSADAGRFLRGKLDSMGGGVRTAQDFIDQIATKSSMSGEPYQIRFPDGRSVPAAQFLGEELRRMGR